MLGKAMDTTMPGMPMSHIREVGMRMQRGGVGYYPTANTPFVHLDVGNVRSWPRMTYDQLARLFPDGKTVHLPTNGQPLPGYEQARAEIEARGDGAYVTAPRNPFGGFFAMLFGGGAEEDDSEVAAPAPSNRKQWALATRKRRGAASDADGGEEGGGESAGNTRAQTEIARAQADLPRGETTMSAPGEAPAESAAPEQSSEAPSTAESSEEAPPPKRVKAPFPPRRPSMLLATVSEAPLRGGRATSSKTTETKDAHTKSSTDKRGASSRQTELTTAPLDASGFTRSTATSGKNKAVAPTTTATAAKAKTSSPATSASTTKPAPATKPATTAKPVTTAKPAASTKPATSEPATNGAKRKN